MAANVALYTCNLLLIRSTQSSVLPMQQADKFKKLGIKPPKGALMYGPPGTGKTLLARACAAQTNACYLKLAGPSLVQVRAKSRARFNGPVD